MFPNAWRGCCPLGVFLWNFDCHLEKEKSQVIFLETVFSYIHLKAKRQQHPAEENQNQRTAHPSQQAVTGITLVWRPIWKAQREGETRRLVTASLQRCHVSLRGGSRQSCLFSPGALVQNQPLTSHKLEALNRYALVTWANHLCPRALSPFRHCSCKQTV